jgi:hypothetical protein
MSWNAKHFRSTHDEKQQLEPSLNQAQVSPSGRHPAAKGNVHEKVKQRQRRSRKYKTVAVNCGAIKKKTWTQISATV